MTGPDVHHEASCFQKLGEEREIGGAGAWGTLEATEQLG
jgi:hypothetical protein